MRSNSKKSSLFSVLGGMFLAVLAVGGVYYFNPLELKIFWAGNIVTLFVFLITMDASKKSNNKLERKIDKIIEKLGIVVDELPLKNKDKPVSIEATERKCWFKAKGYR